jgi:sugar/nucleoside kinase (ribokinase family)
VGLACAALGVARRPLLIAAVGDDAQGRMVEASLSAAHVRVSGLCVAGGRRTPHVVELLGSGGEMLVGVADFALALRLEDLRRHAGALERARVVVVDGNAAGLLDCVRGLAGRGAGLFFEPTSVSKAAAGAAFLRYFDCVTPNARELSALARTLPAAGGDVAGLEGVEDAVARDAARVFAEMTLLGAARRPKTLLVSMGSRGVLLMHAFRGEVFRGTRRAPSERDATLGAWEAGACVTGAGDAQMGVLAFLAGHLPSAMACPDVLLALATRAAARTVRARQSVSALVGEGLRRDLASSGKALEC